MSFLENKNSKINNYQSIKKKQELNELEKLEKETIKVKNMIKKSYSFKSGLSITPVKERLNKRREEYLENKNKDLTFKPSLAKTERYKSKIVSKYGDQMNVHDRLYNKFIEDNF